MLSRRRFLGAATAAWACAITRRPARAIGPGSQFRISQLAIEGTNWNPRPTALRRLCWEVEKRTAIDAARDPVVVKLNDSALFHRPFLYLAGDGDMPLPNAAGIDALRRFLTLGGFMVIDSAQGAASGAFDHAVRQLMEAVFPPPAKGLTLVPPDHVIYKSFYLLDRPVGRIAVSPTLEGVMQDGRMLVAYAQNDLGGAWARDNFGNYLFQCEPGGERQRELAFRLGINLVMYALCLDYKADQVHVPFIMRRRRWRGMGGGGSAVP